MKKAGNTVAGSSGSVENPQLALPAPRPMLALPSPATFTGGSDNSPRESLVFTPPSSKTKKDEDVDSEAEKFEGKNLGADFAAVASLPAVGAVGPAPPPEDENMCKVAKLEHISVGQQQAMVAPTDATGSTQDTAAAGAQAASA